MTDQTHNLNLAECLRSSSNFGNTVVHNVCSGERTVVPWGSLDWFGVALIGTLGVALLLVVLFALFAFARNVILDY